MDKALLNISQLTAKIEFPHILYVAMLYNHLVHEWEHINSGMNNWNNEIVKRNF